MTPRLPLLLALVLTNACFAADLTEARRLIEDKRVPEAKPLLEEAVKESPADADAWFLLGKCQAQMSQGAEAIVSLEKALALAPTRVDILNLHGGCCMNEAGKQRSLSLVKKARASLEKAIELDPTTLDARYALIGFYSNAPWIAGGSMSKAMDQAKAMRKYHPDNGVHVLISLHQKEKEWDQAFSLCDEQLKLTPDKYHTHFLLGHTAALSGRRGDDGLASLKRCLAMKEDRWSGSHADVTLCMAVIHLKSGRKEEAAPLFEQALALKPGDERFRKQVEEARKG